MFQRQKILAPVLFSMIKADFTIHFKQPRCDSVALEIYALHFSLLVIKDENIWSLKQHFFTSSWNININGRHV